MHKLTLSVIIFLPWLVNASFFEKEPNNQPLSANLIEAPLAISGEMTDKDQDAFVWDVKDTDADYFWDIELQGIVDRLTRLDVMTVELTDDGKQVQSVKKLFSLSNQQGKGCEKKQRLMFAPGQYYFVLSAVSNPSIVNKTTFLTSPEVLQDLDEQAIASAKNTESLLTTTPQIYVLKLLKGKKISPIKFKKNSKEKPARIKDGYHYGIYYDSNSRWIYFDINEKKAQQKWKIAGSTVQGNQVKLKLYDEKGQLLIETQSEKAGYYEFSELQFSPGRYMLEFNSRENHVLSTVQKTVQGEIVEGQEAEPNDQKKLANRLTIGQTIEGRFSKAKEKDFYQFDVNELASTHKLRIHVNNTSEQTLELCLQNDLSKNLKCKKSATDMTFNNIVLNSGTYYLLAGRGQNQAQYQLSIVDDGLTKPMIETEPNDVFVNAVPLNHKRMIKGQFEGSDNDFFSFDVDEEPQLWTIQANGNNIKKMILYNAAGKNIQEYRYSKGNKRARLSNVFLMPGRHVVSVHGSQGSYLLRAFATGKPDVNFEREPNNDASNSMLLSFDQQRKGVFENTNDIDVYHFHLDSAENIQLTMTPAIDGDMTSQLYWHDEAHGKLKSQLGQPLIISGWFQAGEYRLHLKARSAISQANYQIELKRLEQFVCQQDCEPNNSIEQAEMLPEHFHLSGFSGDRNDVDWYQMPIFDEPTSLLFDNDKGDKRTLKMADAQGKLIKGKWDRQALRYSFDIDAGQQMFLNVGISDQPYDYRIHVNGQAPVDQVDLKLLKDVSIDFQNFASEVKAYDELGQRLEGQIILNNNGLNTQQLTVQINDNNHALKTQLQQQNVTLKPSQTLSLPLTVLLPDDLNHKQKIRIHVGIINALGEQASKVINIRALSDAHAVNPQIFWPDDEQLLGGINVASYAMGAVRTEQDKVLNTNSVGRGIDELFNEYVMLGNGMRYRGGRKNDQDIITIDLAGETAQKIIGTSLNPLSAGSPLYYPKAFELQLSMDGQNFTTALSAELKPIGVEQSFVLPQSVDAKYARLLIKNDHTGKKKAPTLGEWRVIADAQTFKDRAFNIAAPKHGGHVVWSLPQTSRKWDVNLLTEAQENAYARSSNNDDWQWVVGFHHQRMALIDGIEWDMPVLKDKQETFDHVQVMVSRDGPVGPWTEISKHDLSQKKGTQNMVFEQPVWARYVKFNVGNVKPRAYRYMPKTIRVLEHKADDNYRSILGQWGENNQQSFYEYHNSGLSAQQLGDDNLDNHTKQRAHDISSGQQVNGQVQLEQSDKPDWYQFKVAKNHNTMTVTLSGQPTVKTVLHLEDNNGEKVALIEQSNDPERVVYKMNVEPEQTYYLKVSEPPRSVIFTWDTSGSTASYQPLIYRALSHYAEGVIPGRDEVNFLPFGGELLMDEWYAEPYYLKTILNQYTRNDNSSAAETALNKATKALANRQGSKAIIIFTDAVTTKDIKVWKNLPIVQPQVFSIAIIASAFGGAPERQTDLMQDWARVNHGHFTTVNSRLEVEKAFERVAAKLRQPAHYGLQINSDFEQPLGPGTLQITQKQQVSSGAVELILDASGSMLKRLDGKRRINIAKEVLKKAVTEIIPKDTPLAMRVFGDKQANACRTDLAIKLSPLNPDKAAQVIDGITAKNLAKTPIADSLAMVASDLKGQKGKKIVILVTDGEETCDGDPQAAIAKLVDEGFDVRLNIVGFAIDDEELKASFQQWSQLGGGDYFDSNDSTTLKASITQALKTPYSVFNSAGEFVSEGVVNGEPLQLPAGYYTIKVYASDVVRYEKYHVKGEESHNIEL